MPGDHPILASIQPVIDGARQVSLDLDQLRMQAVRLAQRDVGWPDFANLSGAAPQDRADFYFVTSSINFAFTDFETGKVFRVEEGGKTYQDADAMVACLRRAYASGLPILDGAWLRRLNTGQLGEIFRGICRIPMLDERCRNLQMVGQVLEERFEGRFHKFLNSLPPRAYAGGEGLLEHLPRVFPAFQDTRDYRGAQVLFLKRAQLLLWQLHSHFRGSAFFRLEDVHELTIFADYIVPMALNLMGVLRYSESLQRTIQNRRLLPEGSEEEVEIRAFSIWACHLLTHEINQHRPPDASIIAPLLDAHLWFNYHESHHPHHLTRTTSY